MYILKTEHSFDSAHFLGNYKGKCGNIHGHRWKVEVYIEAEKLIEGGEIDSMVMDFGDLKKEVKNMVDFYDHALIIQKETMRSETLNNLIQDGFRVIEVNFRPTAEKFAECFFNTMKEKGIKVKRICVYETPNNCAIYEESEDK